MLTSCFLSPQLFTIVGNGHTIISYCKGFKWEVSPFWTSSLKPSDEVSSNCSWVKTQRPYSYKGLWEHRHSRQVAMATLKLWWWSPYLGTWVASVKCVHLAMVNVDLWAALRTLRSRRACLPHAFFQTQRADVLQAFVTTRKGRGEAPNMTKFVRWLGDLYPHPLGD